MTLKVASSVLLVFASCLGVAAANGELFYWSKKETPETYVAYPTEMQKEVDQQANNFVAESYPLPVFHAYQAFPETGHIRLWSLLKSINTRLHPILWPHVHYYVDDGYEFGCRSYDEETDTDSPISTGHCHRHCLNQGRYCAPQTEEDLPEGREGHDVLREIVRRLCMDEIYHAKDPRFIAYLEEFDTQDCFAQEHVRACSIDALESVGMKFSELVSCLEESSYDLDVPHTVLERNMRHLDEPLEGEYYITDLPLVTIDETQIWRDDLSVNSIFHGYCKAFPAESAPMACEMCAGCQDVRTCLWTLTCDGESLLPATTPEDAVDSNNNDKPKLDVDQKFDEQAFTSTQSSLQETEKGGEGGTIYLVILLFLAIVGLVLAVGYGTYRRNQDAQHKSCSLKDAITSDDELGGRVKEEDEEDEEEEEETHYRKRAQQLLAEVSMGKYGIYNGEKLTGRRYGDQRPLC